MKIKRTLAIQSTKDGINYEEVLKDITIVKEPHEDGTTVIRGLFEEGDVSISEVESILDNMQYVNKQSN